MSNILYREITPYSDSVDRWNNVTINAGAAQSTLQDIKLPEGAGSFTYHSSGDLSSSCSNRFIYWRTSHDVIELVEISLDVGLRSNHLRLRFQNTPILRGVSIHENIDEVIILVATVSAIHKLSFPHPRRLERDIARMKKRDITVSSIFYDTTEEVLRSRSCYFVLNHVSLGNPLPHTSCSWLDADGSANFVLANSAGSVLLMVMSERHGVQVTKELMKTGSIFRIFNGLVPNVIKSNRTEIVLSIICHQYPSDILVYSLFSDLQIRIWSNKKQDYILVDSVLNFDSQKSLGAGNFTAHQCQLRKSESIDDLSLYLGVFVPVLHQKIFYIFKQSFINDQIQLELVSTLYQTQYDLVDFCIGVSRIWTLWLSSDNQPIVLSGIIDPALRIEPHVCWIPVDLEPRVLRTIDFGDTKPQDAYIKEIFKIGRFLPSTISKAISIYKSIKSVSFAANVAMEIDNLKNRVIEAVENEIMMKAGDIDHNDKEYQDVTTECWDRFFSYCIQYHEVGMKPLGMVVDYNTGCVIVIKKNFYSLLCPCDPLQYLVSPDFRSTSFYISNLENDDRKQYQGLKAILSCMDLIREVTDPKLLMRFEEKIHNLYPPIKYASEIAKTLDLNYESNFLKEMQSLLPALTDVIAALNFLVQKLDLGVEAKAVSEANFTRYPSFGSSLSGIGALCSGLTHFAKQRFEFCRDMLLFEVVLWGLESMESDQLDNLIMQSSVIPKTINLVRSYYVILWCTQCDCVPVTPSIQDSAFKQFCVLELPEYTSTDLTTIKRDCTVSHLFFQEDGGSKARQIMYLKHTELSDENNWATLLPSLIVASAALLWPLEGNIFPEFLFSQCQFLPLQGYDHLLEGWCLWNKQYLNFLVATSFLILGNHSKALDLFLNVSKEIESESFLCNRLLKGRYNSNSSLISLFCMRVIQMFEEFSLSECVIKLVSTIIDEIDESDPHVPIFYSVLFKHYLNLGHSEKAFATLIKNPDPSRKKDCLRQLIVYLCEKKHFQKIIELSYLAFEEEIISILESRARCSDLTRNTSFYGILYALHIHHKKFRKAASVMYELAMRFGREVSNLAGLSKQTSCYLTAINCLYLAEPEYAWIVKPSLNRNVETVEEMEYKNSPKRDANGDEILNTIRPVRVEVLGLEDIRREYNLVQARLEYAQKQRNSSNLMVSPLTPEETVALLLNASLFDSAIRLSESFSLSLIPVFEVMTYRCLNSVLCSDTYSSHETEKDVYTKPDLHEDAKHNVQQNMWNMLEKYLFKYEAPGKSELHKCITEKLFTHGASLPAWLKLSYQKRNFTEMISIFISHGLLEDALNLMIKYIKAVLGVQKEDFGLKSSLHFNSPPVWLPHAYIDILLSAASDMTGEEPFKILYQELSDTLDQYDKTVKSVTTAKLAT